MIIVLEADIIGGTEMIYEGVFVGQQFSEVVGWHEVCSLDHYRWLTDPIRPLHVEDKAMFMRICIVMASFSIVCSRDFLGFCLVIVGYLVLLLLFDFRFCSYSSF